MGKEGADAGTGGTASGSAGQQSLWTHLEDKWELARHGREEGPVLGRRPGGRLGSDRSRDECRAGVKLEGVANGEA